MVRRVFGGDNHAIVVKGHDDLLVYRARCCNPIKGEDVVGYVTRGKGVAVHSKNCPNVQNLLYEADRRIDVEWGKKDSAAAAYPVKLVLMCDDRAGMLKQMTALISDENTNIRNISPSPPAISRRSSTWSSRSKTSSTWSELSAACARSPACTTCSESRKYRIATQRASPKRRFLQVRPVLRN